MVTKELNTSMIQSISDQLDILFMTAQCICTAFGTLSHFVPQKLNQSRDFSKCYMEFYLNICHIVFQLIESYMRERSALLQRLKKDTNDQ